MLINFFFALRAAKLPVSVKEYLMLLEALQGGVIDDEPGPSVDKFYYLARATLVKDEANFDKFDRAFAAYFKGVELLADGVVDDAFARCSHTVRVAVVEHRPGHAHQRGRAPRPPCNWRSGHASTWRMITTRCCGAGPAPRA